MNFEKELEFANSIDYAPLFRNIELFNNTVLTFTQPKIEVAYNRVQFSSQSQDIRLACGVMAKTLDSCMVDVYGYVFEDKLLFALEVSLVYKHINGGWTNRLLFRLYFTNGEWIFDNEQGGHYGKRLERAAGN